MATARTFTAEKFTLMLDGVACGFLETLEGGDISADVVVEQAGPAALVKKHLGQPKYEPFTVQFGFSLAQQVYDWIAAAWTDSFVRKDGSITTVDMDGNARAQSQFSHALVTGVTMPGPDARSKEAAVITLAFAPEITKPGKASGKAPAIGGKAKRATLAAFRLELDGVDCTHVIAIDPFTIEVPVAVDAVGETRQPTAEPGPVRFPNLRVTVGDVPASASWQSWFDDFVIKGLNDASHEKRGAIVYLSPDLHTELARVTLHDVGIFALRRHPQRSGKEGVRSFVAELYCERMELHVGKPAPAPAPPAPAKPVRPVDGPVRPVVTPTRPLGIQR